MNQLNMYNKITINYGLRYFLIYFIQHTNILYRHRCLFDYKANLNYYIFQLFSTETVIFVY